MHISSPQGLSYISLHVSFENLVIHQDNYSSSVGGQVPVLMAKSRLRDGTEPAVFVPEVAKQHDVLSGAIAFGVLVSARASF